MARKTRGRRAPRAGTTLAKRVAALEEIVGKSTRTHVNVRREEHDHVLRMLDQLDVHTKELRTQFARIAQIQAELDEIKRAWAKMAGTPAS